MPTAWILVRDTVTQGTILSITDGWGFPVIYATKADADAAALAFTEQHNADMREHREWLVANLGRHVNGAARIAEIRAICEDYQYDEEPMDWPVEVEVRTDEYGRVVPVYPIKLEG